jgi:hypothetical protein
VAAYDATERVVEIPVSGEGEIVLPVLVLTARR